MKPMEYFYVAAIAVGLADVLYVSVKEMRRGNWSLDYIAFLALVISLLTRELLAGTVIAFMYVGGELLEAYAARRARRSLSALLARIPKVAIVKTGDTTKEVPLAEVQEGAVIVVRHGELIPLDGFLETPTAILDLANLTGEAEPQEAHAGIFIKSGSVNAGEVLELRVSGTLATSTYAKIVDLVRAAERDQAPFVRLAEKANWPFTIASLAIAGLAYLFTADITRALAVLVIATPCPLIIAAPVAFVGGLSRAARGNIIVKRPAALEIVTRVKTIFFDKTGTLTLGTPTVAAIELLDGMRSRPQALSIAASLEFHSIHPTARAIVAAAKDHGFTPAAAEKVTEALGIGIAGTVAGKYVSIEPAPEARRRPGAISLMLSEDGEPVALFHLADTLKDDAREVLDTLVHEGYKVAILTGDSRIHAEHTLADAKVAIYADLAPDDKYKIVDEARARGEVVAMIGDGLNDAPALARADVGIVFSGTENSASIEAADIAILGHDLASVREVFAISRRSVHIARQSVYAGIGLSIVGQLFAATGFILPVIGALIQEAIDVTVITNALRSAFAPRSR